MYKIINKDSILGCLVILISVFLIIHTRQASETVFYTSDDISPFLIPSYYLYIATLCGVYFLTLGLRSKINEHNELKHLNSIIIVAVSLITVYIMEYLGFLIIMPFSVYICGLMLGYKKHIKLILISVISVIFIWFTLTFIGNMPLPIISIG